MGKVYVADSRTEGATVSLFKNDTLDVPCPQCRHLTTLTVGWLERNCRFACERCDSDLEIDGPGLLEDLRDVESSIDALTRAIARLRKRV